MSTAVTRFVPHSGWAAGCPGAAGPLPAQCPGHRQARRDPLGRGRRLHRSRLSDAPVEHGVFHRDRLSDGDASRRGGRMRNGCCPDPKPDAAGRTGRHLITSTVYKTARDDDGNHRSEGEVRDAPWVAIAPVVNAIRVLERMVSQGQLLFDHHAHDLRGTRVGTGSLTVHTLGKRVEDFITWANHEATARGLAGEVFPPDPRGRIAPSGSAGAWPGTSPAAPGPCRARDSVRSSADCCSGRVCRAQPGRHPRPPRRRDGPRHHRDGRQPECRSRGRPWHLRARRPPGHQGRRHRAPVHRHRHHRPAGPPDPRQLRPGRLRQSPHAADVRLQARQGPVSSRPRGHPQPRPVRPRLCEHRPHRSARHRPSAPCHLA
ncbi:hypothetical protein a10_00047 [Streptomyces acidiscabies]|nr:hypothetical protein a10_00047 [Streptomyces acidiscabies]GAV37174.1 hypothetical protein Saa2_00047 [Streptomyces acidiscabies]